MNNSNNNNHRNNNKHEKWMRKMNANIKECNRIERASHVQTQDFYTALIQLSEYHFRFVADFDYRFQWFWLVHHLCSVSHRFPFRLFLFFIFRQFDSKWIAVLCLNNNTQLRWCLSDIQYKLKRCIPKKKNLKWIIKWLIKREK